MNRHVFYFGILVGVMLGDSRLAYGAMEGEGARILAETEERIRDNRTAPLTIFVKNEQGKPLPGKSVQVKHVRHLFKFGAGFDMRLLPQAEESEADRRHRENFLRLFNYATIHLYWGRYEPQRGAYQDAERLRAIEWLKEHQITARGHPIFWNQDNTLPRWLHDLEARPDRLRQLFDERLAQLSKTILPHLEDVDVFNELARWERFTNSMTRLMKAQGKVAVVTHYLKEARRLNPGVELVVNDYDVSAAFPELVRKLIEAGAPVDIIGQQSHMHDGNWSAEKTWSVLERLSALRRPILFSELSVLSGPRRQTNWQRRERDWHTDAENEQKQADYLEQFYRLLYSRPEVMGIVIWNYSDRSAWLGAPVGVLRPDGTPKPSFERLDKLINHHWRTRGEFRADDQGRIVIANAFEGEYAVQCGNFTVKGQHQKGSPLEVNLRINP